MPEHPVEGRAYLADLGAGLASGTRSGRLTSPLLSGSWVTLVAVAATRRSGRRDARTHAVPITPVMSRAARNTASSAAAT